MRKWLAPGVILLLLLAAGAWLASVTEWVEEPGYVSDTGEAAMNPLYAVQALARRLGAEVVKQGSLEHLPPAGATLVLSSQYWNLLPGREHALRAWVEQGGHLVIDSHMLDQDVDEDEDGNGGGDDALARWVPVRRAKSKPPSEAAPASVPERAADRTGARAGRELPGDLCRHFSETGPSAGAGFRLCGDDIPLPLELKPGAAGLWSADGAKGPEFLRAAVGKGSVTVVSVSPGVFQNRQILRGGNALAWVAMLGLRSGMVLWFVAEEGRAPLLLWLWPRAWVALLLGLLALGAALWRGGRRFGPRQALAPVERRSMAEQIVGTAHFLARSDAQALHRAQLRALGEAAAPRLRHWAKLNGPARARAVAAATGMSASALANAMAGDARSKARLEADLCYLESAVRRLRAGAAAEARPSS